MINNNKGFSLVSMLGFFAAIALLLAFIYPALQSGYEKTLEMLDMANIRCACSQISMDSMFDAAEPQDDTNNIEYKYTNGSYEALVTAQQLDAESWLFRDGANKIEINSIEGVPAKANPDTWTVTYDSETRTFTIS